MKRFILAVTASITVVLSGVLLPLAATAQTQQTNLTPAQQSCEALRLQDPTVDCSNTSSLTDSEPVRNIFTTVIDIFSVVVGAVSVIMIIIGGFRYIISGGDSNGTKAAKDTILYAVIGLVVVLFAQVIVRFVFTQVS